MVNLVWISVGKNTLRLSKNSFRVQTSSPGKPMSILGMRKQVAFPGFYVYDSTGSQRE